MNIQTRSAFTQYAGVRGIGPMIVFVDGPAPRNDEVLLDLLAVGQMMDARHDGGQQRLGNRHQ